MSILLPIKKYLAISDKEVAELEKAQDEIQFNVSNYEAIVESIEPGLTVSIHEPVKNDRFIF